MYTGLSKCIKNDMVHHRKPNTPISLHGIAQAIDALIGNTKQRLLAKPATPELLETNLTQNMTLPNPTPSWEMGLCSQRITTK